MLTFKEKLKQLKDKYLNPKYDEKTREEVIEIVASSMLDYARKYPVREVVEKIIMTLQSPEFNQAAMDSASKHQNCKQNEDPFVRFATDYVMENYK